MPSMRPYALNPRAPAAPSPRAIPPTPPPTGVPAQNPSETPAETAIRAGGFHESSYELQHGLLVSESEWPDDVTVPGALDDL